MKYGIKVFVAALVAWQTVAVANESIDSTSNSDIEIITSPNVDGKITPKSIEEAFRKAGFVISANRDMNGPFRKQFKTTTFETYNLLTLYKPDMVLKLAKKHPNIGLFAPMSMSIYTKKGDHTISVSSLSAQAMAKIMKMSQVDPTLLALKQLVRKTLQKAMPNGTFHAPQYHVRPLVGNRVTQLSMEMDKDEWDDELDEFKMGFEGELSSHGFVIAGFNDLADYFDDAHYDGYDIYQVYSICKLPVIYTIAKTHPEAGAFAPCSMYLAKKKNENVLHIGFPSVYNWISSMSLHEKEEIQVLKEAQQDMEKILQGLTE